MKEMPRNTYMLVGKEDLEGFRIFFPSHCLGKKNDNVHLCDDICVCTFGIYRYDPHHKHSTLQQG